MARAKTTANGVLNRITSSYLLGREFNGTLITNLSSDNEKTRSILRNLILDEKVVLNFGDRHPNPHILALEPEPREQQLEKLDRLVFEPPQYENYGPLRLQINSINCCAYPSTKHLQTVVDPAQYHDKPYTLLLALGEPQLAFRSFNLRILEFYRNEPRYSYETDDIHGHISTRGENDLEPADDTFLETFGFAYSKDIKKRYVAVFLRYLSGLTPEHQQRWKLEQVNGEILLHPEYSRTTAGHWPTRESIFIAFLTELSTINQMCRAIGWQPLFRKEFQRHEKPRDFGFLIRPTAKEFNDFVLSLDKLLTENINKNFFEGKVPLTAEENLANGKVKVRDKGTIALLEEWIKQSFRTSDPKPIDEAIAAIKEARSLRQRPAHKLEDNSFDQKYFQRQRDLIMSTYAAVRLLRLVFERHPNASGVDVPKWLREGEIWSY
jgi:hypothetical protein